MPHENITITSFASSKTWDGETLPTIDFFVDDYTLAALQKVQKGDIIKIGPKKAKFIDEKKPHVNYSVWIKRAIQAVADALPF